MSTSSGVTELAFSLPVALRCPVRPCVRACCLPRVVAALLDRARTEADTGERMALLAEAERVLVEEELPMVPIFHYVSMYMFDPDRITGMSAQARTKQNLFLIDVLGDGVGAEQPRPMKRRDPARSERAG